MSADPPSEATHTGPGGGDGDTDTVLGVLAGRLNQVNAELVAVTEQLLRDDGWRQGGMRSPAQFLAWKLGLSPERARAVVTVARRRREFPTIIASFDAGELSLEQVVEAVKAPAWADELIHHFCTIAPVAKLRRAMRSSMFEGPTDDATPIATACDRVSFGVGRDGRWRIRGELGVDDGRRVEAALLERKDALFADDETVTMPQAFVDCFDRSLAAVTSPARRDQFRTWLHLDVTDRTATTTDGWRIPQSVGDRVLCDGVVQPVWESDGLPFSVGRTQRIVPDRTRRIIERRDRGCRVPGCSAEHVEVHHIVHWLDGGPTATPNLISLCPKHHRMHHAGQLLVAGDADTFDAVTFADADGNPIQSRGSPVVPAGPPTTESPPYRPPINGRFDWDWIGLGWVHPAEQLLRRHRRSDAA